MPKAEKSQATDWKGVLDKLESTLQVYLVDKAPGLPENIKEIIVKLSPWLTLILLIIAIPAILITLGLGAILSPFALLGGLKGGTSYGFGLIFSVLTLVVLVIEALAIPGLFKRKMSAWRLLFYASLVSAVSSLLSFSLGSLIVGTLISWYVLFQIKKYYK